MPAGVGYPGKRKARKTLRDGKKLTANQKRFFGALAGSKGKSLTDFNK